MDPVTPPEAPNTPIWVIFETRETVYGTPGRDHQWGEASASLFVGPDAGGIMLSLDGSRGKASSRFGWRDVVQALIDAAEGAFGTDDATPDARVLKALAEMGFNVPQA